MGGDTFATHTEAAPGVSCSMLRPWSAPTLGSQEHYQLGAAELRPLRLRCVVEACAACFPAG